MENCQKSKFCSSFSVKGIYIRDASVSYVCERNVCSYVVVFFRNRCPVRQYRVYYAEILSC